MIGSSRYAVSLIVFFVQHCEMMTVVQDFDPLKWIYTSEKKSISNLIKFKYQNDLSSGKLLLVLFSKFT